MYCFNCGKQIVNGSNYCPFCGTKLTNDTLNYTSNDQSAHEEQKNEQVLNNPSAQYQNPYFNQPQSSSDYQQQNNQYYQPQQPIYPQYAPVPRAKTNSISLVGFILALCSVVFLSSGSFMISIGLAIAGLTLGIIGIRQHNEDPSLKGKGFSVTSIAVSASCIGIWIIAIIFVIIFSINIYY